MNTQLQTLREEYKTASNERKKEIIVEAEKIKSKLCHECKENDRLPENDDHFPYCSKECHEAWANKNYGPGTREGKRRPTVDEMRMRLKEMAKQSYIKEKTDPNGQMRI